MNWKWAQLGRHGGMMISNGPLSLTVHWPREGGCVVQWWIAGRFVRDVPVSVA